VGQPGAEKVRSFLVNWVFTSICGMTISQWTGMLRQHRFGIDPPYWPRAAFVTGASLVTTLLRRYEDMVYRPKIRDVAVKPPLFILGHRRSGTTHLLNLLTIDEQFAYPNMFQALNPHTFLTTERFSKYVRVLSPKTRIIDNMKLGFEVPFEDEFATCNSTLHSPYLSWAFPQYAHHYDRYLTFRDVPEEEIKQWQAGLVLFLKKLTWKYDRPLLLKSPPHTCRIKLLLELCPEARFVHIHRNPYNVFQSAQRQTLIMSRATRLQNATGESIDARIIEGYKQMYDVFFEERAYIPAGQFHEMCFEALEKDRVGQIQQLYQALDLPGFEVMQPSLQRYVDSLAGYQKNEYTELPTALRSQIAQAWRRSFEEWGYA
jgi:hypothetical protein